MKRTTLFALGIVPLLAGAAGFFMARMADAGHAVSGAPCVEPTVYIDLADGAALVTAGSGADASCNGATCRVAGPEQVEVQADGAVQCVAVSQGQALALTRGGDGIAYDIQDIGR